MIELEVVEKLIAIASGIATVLVVFLLWKTVRHLEESTKLSRVQVAHRFRPWVGPSSGIEFMDTANEKQQFGIKLKNYGELPASNVTTAFIIKNEMLNRDALKNPTNLENFSLGPLLPNMEKRYWFFIDSDLMQKARDGNTQIFVGLYFAYEFAGGRSGYGMISHFDTNAKTFVHKDMWVD